jgi:hypothetical protein
MPLARIITRSPEHTSALSQQLQLEGYSVEVAAPGEVHAQPADLEIDFALCNPAEALQRASRQASELGADLVVASGVLELAMQPVPVAPVKLQPDEVVEVHAQPEEQTVPMEVVSSESIPAEVVAMPSGEEETSHELPSYNAHFARNLGAQLGEALAVLGMAAVDLRKRLAGHLRAAVASTRSSIASRTHEYQERIRQRAAEKQAAQEQQHAEIASQQAEAQRLTDVDLPAQQQLESELVAAAATLVPRPSPGVPVFAAPQSKMARKQRASLQLRGIFTGAAAASVLFVVGLLLANVHQKSPLLPSMTQTSVEQHVPFGAIIVQGTPSHSTVTATRPQVVTPSPKPQTRESSQATARKKPHPYHRRVAAHESDDDVTVDDVTVRHFPSPVRRPIQQQAKFKRYSDLE